MSRADWVTADNAALLTDLYELTMLQAYHREGLQDTAVFDLFVRKLPPNRGFLLAAGLETALDYLENLHFPAEALEYLGSLGQFSDAFLDYLAGFRFTGEVRAVPEGSPVFPDEPLLEVIAPLPEAQLAETFLLNQIHFQTLMASKASRVVEAAQGRSVVDFGARRMHGADATLKAARAFYIAGVHATSNVLAGQVYGIPVSGTMAHSYIEAHPDELAVFEAFARLYPETILLVDTYDTLEGVRKVADMAERWGDAFRVRGIRLDSGDLGELARGAREILDARGLHGVSIFASGSLDEYAIADLLEDDAPIDGFGVGTHLGVSEDSPYLDSAYKLVEYAGEPRMKLATSKTTLPARKQVYRHSGGEGFYGGDTIAALEEPGMEGQPLLETVMREGERLLPRRGLDEIRNHAAREREHLPANLRGLRMSESAYPVAVSEGLKSAVQRLRATLQR
ncbi:nicotinate phosphoribosyltransferase [Thiohalorhabdus denitrificans]|uniref:Nicotinate phosphoribosyltransferase n=1 Tax=Thiohalorhabdus denitrificans TaxID=381306 RepID=A0A1G5ARP9_9GAMM|nr:nicotinate phosphoribosyltransferase [Thiohalorhabdus denitrificans]SCX80529.1 nicotinate phosphoribosyltransferase [Thiohalorhabdus denitrificans]